MPRRKPRKVTRLTDSHVTSIAANCEDYHEFRKAWWEAQDLSDVNFASDTRGDKRLTGGDIVMQPKRNLFFKDCWHCGSGDDARALIAAVASFSDVRELQFKGSWVYVKHDDYLKDFELEGQDIDSRQVVRGR